MASRSRPPAKVRVGLQLVLADRDALVAVVEERVLDRGWLRIPPAQVALAWLQSKPYVTSPIIGATKPQHLADAIASTDLELSNDEIARLEAPYVPHPVLGFN